MNTNNNKMNVVTKGGALTDNLVNNEPSKYVDGFSKEEGKNIIPSKSKNINSHKPLDNRTANSDSHSPSKDNGTKYIERMLCECSKSIPLLEASKRHWNNVIDDLKDKIHDSARKSSGHIDFLLNQYKQYTLTRSLVDYVCNMLNEYIGNQNKDINITTNEDSSSPNDINYSYKTVEENRSESSL